MCKLPKNLGAIAPLPPPLQPPCNSPVTEIFYSLKAYKFSFDLVPYSIYLKHQNQLELNTSQALCLNAMVYFFTFLVINAKQKRKHKIRNRK